MKILPNIPPVYATEMITQLMNGIDKLLTYAEETREDNFKQQYISTATESGIAKYERIEKIIPLAGQDLESRRAACQTKWNSFVPYTEPTLKEMLDTWCNNGYTYEIQEDSENECLRFVLESSFNLNAQADSVYYQLNTVLPANFIIDIRNNPTFSTDSELQVESASANITESEVN